MKSLRDELLDFADWYFQRHSNQEMFRITRYEVGKYLKSRNSDAQAESPTVGDNEDEKEECEHPYAWVRSKCGYDKCLKCGKVLSEG